LHISTDVIKAARDRGGIVRFNFIGYDGDEGDESRTTCLVFDREQLVAIRSAIDMILTSDEAAHSLGKSPSTT
jgi:hypothetical protein